MNDTLYAPELGGRHPYDAGRRSAQATLDRIAAFAQRQVDANTDEVMLWAQVVAMATSQEQAERDRFDAQFPEF